MKEKTGERKRIGNFGTPERETLSQISSNKASAAFSNSLLNFLGSPPSCLTTAFNFAMSSGLISQQRPTQASKTFLTASRWSLDRFRRYSRKTVATFTKTTALGKEVVGEEEEERMEETFSAYKSRTSDVRYSKQKRTQVERQSRSSGVVAWN
jgi:hypothetical protein